MRRTKIVATLGPATRNPKVLAGIVSVGADVLRLNFSHGTPDQHAELVSLARKTATRAGREIGLLADLPGPKLRLGDVEGDVLQLRHGQPLVLSTSSRSSDLDMLPVTWAGLPSAVDKGDVIYLADGAIRLRVTGTDENQVWTKVESGGAVASHQGINLPDADGGPVAISKTDLDWVDFAVDQEFDLIAVSFVRRADDLEPVTARLRERKVDTPVIAKIEKREAADAAEEIVQAASGGIMVARGDLGIELPLETIPLVQKRLLSLAGRYSKPSITATQMLASMVGSPRPTRAEVTDVANAVYDGTDALMLSEETAVGRYPVEAVRMMSRIAEQAEKELPYGEWLLHRTRREEAEVAEMVSYGAVGAANQLGLAALVVPTSSGRTARLVSAHRPRVPVLALSSRLETVRRLNLLFGVRATLSEDPENLEELLAECARQAKAQGLARSGDLIGVTAGIAEQQLGTNLFEVQRVP